MADGTGELDPVVAETPGEVSLGVGHDAVTEADCRWVYQNYADDGTTQRDAPSAGAWGLLQGVRNDPAAYRLLVDKLTPKQFRVVDPGVEDAIRLSGINQLIRDEWAHAAQVLKALE